MNLSYIRFVEQPVAPDRKTSIWNVTSKEGGDFLGQVKWFGRWRCYSFSPNDSTVFEKSCLRVLADFCEEKTKAHRSGGPASR